MNLKKIIAIVSALMIGIVAHGATVSWSIAVRQERTNQWGTFIVGNQQIGDGTTVLTAEQVLVLWVEEDATFGSEVFDTEELAKAAADSHHWGVWTTLQRIGSEETLLTDARTFSATDKCVMRATLKIVGKPSGGREIEPGYYPIPEPTSGLMVLVGLGLLILKRKEVAV